MVGVVEEAARGPSAPAVVGLRGPPQPWTRASRPVRFWVTGRHRDRALATGVLPPRPNHFGETSAICSVTRGVASGTGVLPSQGAGLLQLVRVGYYFSASRLVRASSTATTIY